MLGYSKCTVVVFTDHKLLVFHSANIPWSSLANANHRVYACIHCSQDWVGLVELQLVYTFDDGAYGSRALAGGAEAKAELIVST